MSITAVLLAAGYATRLYPLTSDRPKALLPLGQGVILDAVLRALEPVPEVVARILVTNHRFVTQFQEWQRASGPDVRIVDDGTRTPEARLGAIRDLELARGLADPADDLLVLGTDNLFRWPLAEFVALAKPHRPQSSIALWEAPSSADATQFGVVVRDRTLRITSFVEKSPQPPSREVALCVYYFPAAMGGEIARFLNEGGNADAPGYFIAWLAGWGAVYGIMMDGAWYDIGSLETYEVVKQAWSGGGKG